MGRRVQRGRLQDRDLPFARVAQPASPSGESFNLQGYLALKNRTPCGYPGSKGT